MSNKYLETLERQLVDLNPEDIICVDPGYAILALTVELQTLNEILKDLVQVGPRGDHYISVAVSD